MRNFTHIGFEVENLEDFQSLAEAVYRNGTAFRAGRDQYYQLTDPSGAELWAQIDANDEIAGMNAHFDGQHWIQATLLRAQAHEERPLEGKFEASAVARDSSKDSSEALVVFAFDLPDAHLVPSVPLPAAASIQLVGFARELHCYDSLAAFEHARPGQALHGLESTRTASTEAELPSTLTRLSGEILAAKALLNQYTWKTFYWLEVETLIGLVEVVASLANLPSLPQPGQVLDGTVRLSGRVEVRQEARKPGLVERFFWGASTNQRQE